jgi:type II secretory pathway component GspD/PulD (secretin)
MFRKLVASGLALAVWSLGSAPVAMAQDAPAVAESPVRATTNGDSQTTVRFSFREAAWERVFAWLAEKADLTLDLTDLPPGTFNYQDDREHTIAEAMDAINGYLLPRGYVTLRRDQFLVVLKTDNPILPNLIPTVPAGDLEDYGNNELVRILVPVNGFKPSEVAEQVQQFLGTFGKAAPVDASNAVLLQGFGKSLRIAEAILSSAQAPAGNDELTFRSFPLKHISAADAERQIQKLFGLGNNPFAASLARRESYFQRRRDDDDDQQEDRSTPAPLMQHLSMNMKVSALARTNSLLVAATPSAIKLVESILASIDVTSGQGEGEAEFLDDSTPLLRVYTVTEADEDDVAETINAIMPGVVLNEDGRHDSIHVYATAKEHKEVEQLIKMVDQAGAGGGVEVITLYRMDPYQMSELLNSLFVNESRADRPVITPELRSQSLVIRASSSQMAEIKKTLIAYGESNSFRNEVAESDVKSSRFRKVAVPNGRAEWIARAVKEVLSEDEQFENPIRVIVPGEVSKNASNADSPADAVRTKRIPLSEESRARSKREAGAIRTVKLTETTLASTTEAACDGSDEPAPPQTSERPRVTIEVRDGELFMYSNDGQALDEIEETIRELVRQMPTRTNWTVFYLRAATASETATQLGQLLRDESDPYIGIGLPTAAESRLPVGLQTVRIIPDSRTNAIFISGPESKIQEAEKFLELLDTNELPQSLRDRLPRTIAVKHADVEEVAGIVRELYKDYMEDPNARRNERRGDDRRDNEERRIRVEREGDTPQTPGIRLTLAVDTQSSELIVSCNETLFEQIEELVETRDAAALASRPQVQILTLGPENTQSIAESLNALSTKISVGTSSASQSRSNSSNNSNRSPLFRFDSRRNNRR